MPVLPRFTDLRPLAGAVLLWTGCRATPPPVPVDPQASAQTIEVRLLADTAAQALADGRALDAARAVLLGRSLSAAPFDALYERVAASDDPDVLSLLAAERNVDPAMGRAFTERATAARVAARYREGAPTRWWEGVDLARGRVVLDGVVAEYLERPDPAAMAEAVGRRLELLRPSFPNWTAPATGTSAYERIANAVASGLPEPVAVGEGVEAALAALDPYTQAVWPAQIRAWNEHHAGVQSGIGVDLEDGPSGPVVTLPRVGGPAWTGGVHAGDRVVSVSGRTVARAADAAAALIGDPGTSVELTVDRAGTPHSFALVRKEVPEETVRGWSRHGDGWDASAEPGIAYVRLASFRPDTDEAFDVILAERPRAAIVDLRGNGGGDVMAAINVADRFVADGVLADLAGRTLPKAMSGPQGELPWNVAIPGHALEGVPVVVLVDGRTASAAEIVAGALRERAGAVLVGEETFGKGLSQALRVDEALGVGWQVTNGMWTLPSGRTVEAPGGRHMGLVPDRQIALTPGEELQVDAMTRRRELPKAHPDGTPIPDLGTVARPELVPLEEDPQLAEAFRIARDRAR